MKGGLFKISFFGFLFAALMTIVPVVQAQVTDEDGDWSGKYETLQNTPEADLMVRTGDIDNLGFGWPGGFNPFSGNSTPAHSYPWTADTLDPSGTDRIMVITSYVGTPPSGRDGYTTYTSRPENSVRPIRLSFALNGLPVSSAILQIFVDDFQAGLWKASYQVTINNVRAHFMEAIINGLMQTGPVGKLISVEIPAEYLYLVEKDRLDIVFDDFTTGAGDGYAIDFIKLLINPASITQVGTITGTVYDQSSVQPLEGVRVVANGRVADTTDVNGFYSLDSVLAGIVNIQTFKEGYGSQITATELIAGGSKTVNFYLRSPAPVVVSVVPEDSTFRVYPDASLTVRFNQYMDTLTFNGANFSLSMPDSSIDGRFIRTDTSFTFIPVSPLSEGASYRAELTTGIKNMVGVALSEPYVWSFFTFAQVGLDERTPGIPRESLLRQNYPNPFNPVTTITFQISKSKFTILKVYNILGKEVATLASGKLNPGTHTYRFDGGNLASGIYYCVLVTGEYREARKMVLVR